MAQIPQKRKRALKEQKRQRKAELAARLERQAAGLERQEQNQQRKAEFAAELERRDKEMKAQQRDKDAKWNKWTVGKHVRS